MKYELSCLSRIEFVPINDDCENASEESRIIEKQNIKEKSETLDFKIEVVSEKFLKNNIAYVSNCYKFGILQFHTIK